MFEILYADDVAEELQRLHARDRAIIVDRIKKQLRYEPAKATRAKKLISGLKSRGWSGDQFGNCELASIASITTWMKTSSR